MTWDAIPETLLTDCAQLVKANSIEGNKKDNLTVIYTPADNLKKTGDMAVGQVSFHSDKKVKRVHVPKRENAIVNRLNKTKIERVVDHEQERVDRQKREAAVRRAAAAEKVGHLGMREGSSNCHGHRKKRTWSLHAPGRPRRPRDLMILCST